jgi:hypothetical protein
VNGSFFKKSGTLGGVTSAKDVTLKTIPINSKKGRKKRFMLTPRNRPKKNAPEVRLSLN